MTTTHAKQVADMSNNKNIKWYFSRLMGLIPILTLALVLMAPTFAHAADSTVPGRKMISAAPVEPAQARTIISARTVPTLYSPTAATPAEISSLARGLKSDVDLIYTYVHDTIQYEIGYGAKKGALGTLLDGSGNAFDQASLMVALLRQAGYTAGYVHGTIRLTGQQISAWLSTADDVDTVRAVLGAAGIPAVTVPASGNVPVSTVDIDHVWVKVEIEGADYVFDPAFKQYTFQAPIDLATVMGYSRTGFLATAGGTINLVSDDDVTQYSTVQNVDRAGVRNALTTYASAIISHVQTNQPDADIRDIIGGRTIDPASTGIRQTSLPYELVAVEEWDTNIPNIYATFLRVTDNGTLDQTFRTDAIYCRRLTVFPSSSTTYLRLDGVNVDTGAAGYDLQFDVDHPYAAADDSMVDGTYGDQTGKVRSLYGAQIYIITGWGRMGREMIDRHRDLMIAASHAGSADDSEVVLGETLGVYGANYLAQLSAAESFTGQLTNTAVINHHNVGVVVQQISPLSTLPADLGGWTLPFDSSNSFFIDMPLTRNSHVDLATGAGRDLSSSLTVAGQASIFESGDIDQATVLNAASAVKALDAANTAGVQVIKVTPANWAVADPIIRGYSDEAGDLVEEYVMGADSWHVIIPLTTAMAIGDWTGGGIIAIKPDGSAIRHIVNSRKGGGTTLAAGQTVKTVQEDEEFEDTNKVPRICPINFTKFPIDMANGRFYHDYQDLTVGSSDLNSLAFSKSYYSTNRLDDSGLGFGWGHNHSSSISKGSDGFEALGAQSPVRSAAAIAAVYVASDVLQSGHTVDKIMIANLVHTWFMEQLTDNVVTISFPGGSKQFIKNPDGTYGDGSCCGPDQLTQDTDGSYLLTTAGGTVYDFDTEGRLAQKTDPNGNTVTYTYTDGNLTYVANSFGRSLTITWTDGRISQVTDGSRSVQYGYDTSGRMITSTDAESNVTMFQYDTANQLTKIYNPTNATIPFVENTYDDLGLVETQSVAGNTASEYFFGGFRSEVVDPAGNSKIWEFPTDRLYGQPKKAIKITDETGRTITNEYDGLMRTVRQTMPEGNFVEYTYDSKNNPLSVTAYDKTGNNPLTTSMTYHTAYNKLASVTDPLSRTTSFAYDGNGNLQTITQPTVSAGTPVTSFTYTAQGLPETKTAPDGMVTHFGYNGTGDLISATLNYGGLNLTTQFGYDTAGNLASVTDPRTNTTNFIFNNQRQIAQATSPSPYSYVTTFGYDADGNLTSVTRNGTIPETITATYSLTGKKLTETSPGTHTTQYQYDDLDRLWKVIDPESRVTEYGYDPAGRLTVVINGKGHNEAQYGYTDNGLRAWVKDANNNTTSYQYDGYDRLVRTVYPYGSYEQFNLDNAGRIQSVLTRDNRTITYGYDDLDRITSRTIQGAPTDTYTYDLAGRIINAATSGLGTFTHVYDTAGRLTSVTDPNTRTVGYQYDAASNRTRIDYPDGSYAVYAYDEMGRMTQVQYDPNNDSTAPAPSTVATYTYDNLSRRDSAALGNGTSAALSYSTDSLVSDIIHTATGGNVTFAYNHDRSGLVTSLTVSDDLFAPFTDIAGTKSFTPNSLNQYTSAMGEAIVHDLNGNLSSDGTNDYVHDAVNRLVTATVGSITWTYAYGPLDRRMSKADGTNIFQYLYDNNRAVAEYNGTGTLLRKYIYGPGLDEPIMMIVPGDTSETVYYYHADSQGTIIGLTNDSGAWVEKYAYTLYGKPAAASTVGNPYMYTGRRLDAETGLYYYRARYYDPHLRRFIETDPIGYAGGMNLYAYVRNSPLNFIDPFGQIMRPDPRIDDLKNEVNQLMEMQRRQNIRLVLMFSSLLPIAPGPFGIGGGRGIFCRIGRGGIGATNAKAGLINPAKVRFSQSSIRSTFSNGGTVDDLAIALKSGKVKPTDIDPIRLVNKDGKLYTLDNRRLEAFKRAGVETPYRMATPEEAAAETWKFTTTNDGISIRVRGE